MSTHLKNQIASTLRGKILAGEWPEGTRIKEEDIAREYGVSRGPIRDVFLELSKEGFLEASPNKGASIHRKHSKAARQIFLETRRQIEALALENGYPLWTEQDHKAIEKILRHFRVAAESEDLPEVIQHDMAFHEFIVDRNPKDNLKVVWRPLMTTLSLPYSRHTRLLESYEEHLKILEKLKNNQLAQAIKLLQKHIQ